MLLAATVTCVALLISACGGGGGEGVANPVNGTLGGTAAVGNPIFGGAMKVICAVAAAFTAPGATLASALATAYAATASGTPTVTVPATPSGVTVSARRAQAACFR